jgi:acetylornithine deacetylase/succinyl-diaminopimelate desuccinylase-like protein
MPARALAYARDHRQRFVAQLAAFVRFPSVSAQPRHSGDVERCAQWLAEELRRIGLDDVSIVDTRGNPLVYAAWQRRPGRPTVLIYGHYDVQPADPIGEWRSPPFVPTIRGQNLYGRGACDDKGQMFIHVKVLEAYLQTGRALPVNVKCLFEGEEEIGSPNLLPFVARNKEGLAADVAVMSDTPMLGPGRPAIHHAVRGALYLELEVHGPRHDLHSGNFGGAVHNPLQVLSEMVAALHDAGGRITIPGFYDRVRHWDAEERAHMARSGPTDAQILADAGARRGSGERGYSLYERLTLRPALTVNGIVGGYQGPGAKGVIPAHALAKLSFRLAPDQDPQGIDRLFRAHIARITPKTVRATVRTLSSAKPAVIARGHPALRAAALAYRKGFGATPVFLRSGGTIPVVDTFSQALRIPTVMMGFALPDDRMHAPNEKFHLPNFYNGIATGIFFLDAIGKAGAGGRNPVTSDRSLPGAGREHARIC